MHIYIYHKIISISNWSYSLSFLSCCSLRSIFLSPSCYFNLYKSWLEKHSNRHLHGPAEVVGQPHTGKISTALSTRPSWTSPWSGRPRLEPASQALTLPARHVTVSTKRLSSSRSDRSVSLSNCFCPSTNLFTYQQHTLPSSTLNPCPFPSTVHCFSPTQLQYPLLNFQAHSNPQLLL